MRRGSFRWAVVFAAGCGGASPPHVQTAIEEPHIAETPVLAQPQVEVEGILGMLSPVACNRALDPRMRQFLRCFSEGASDVEVLSGHVELSFRVGRDGGVRWVYPSESTIGDRDTERCILEVAINTRFPQPVGGEAEFSFPVDFDAASDVRPPHEWTEARVRNVVARNAHEVTQLCRGGMPGAYHVTAYVGPGGQVLSAGASVESADLAGSLDCIADAVEGWSMPNPGSYPAKVSFLLE